MATEGKELKFVLLGNSKVGKTSLVERFAVGGAGTISKDPSTTVASPETRKSLKITMEEGNEMEVTFKVIDTAGSDALQHSTFGRNKGTHCVFLVFDLTNEESLLGIQKENGYRHSGIFGGQGWQEDIEVSFKESSPMVVLVGNKKDRQQDIVAGLREAAEKRANENGMQYCEVSAFGIDDHTMWRLGWRARLLKAGAGAGAGASVACACDAAPPDDSGQIAPAAPSFLSRWLREELARSLLAVLNGPVPLPAQGRTAQGQDAIAFLSRTRMNLWVVGPRGVGKSSLCAEVAQSLHGGHARSVFVDAGDPQGSLLSQCLDHSWKLRGYLSAAHLIEACAPAESPGSLLTSPLDMCLSVLSDVLMAEQRREEPPLPALLLIDSMDYTHERDLNPEGTITRPLAQLESLARLARDLNAAGAAQAVMTTRLLRAGTRCRLPLAGGTRSQRCGVLYLTDWTLDAAAAESSNEQDMCFSDEPGTSNGDSEENVPLVLNSVRSFLNFVENSTTNDTNIKFPISEKQIQQYPIESSRQNDQDMASIIFGYIGGNLGKLAGFMEKKYLQGTCVADICAELVDEREHDLRYQLFDESDYFEMEANTESERQRIDASARHFHALDILLGDQVGLASPAETIQRSNISRGLRPFTAVFEAFNGVLDPALDVGFFQYMTLVPPLAWNLVEEDEESDDLAISAMGNEDMEEEQTPVFEWVDLLDANGEKWHVRADALTLKAFENFLESAVTDKENSGVLLERLRALQQLRFMRADRQQMLEEERVLAHDMKITEEAWDRAGAMYARGEISDEQHLAVQLKLDSRRRQNRTVDAVLRRRAVVIRERELEAQTVLERQRQRQFVKIIV
eukprot:g3665.t1